MTGAAREKDQADFDLERFIDMFDEALTSRDERVINALRSLMMMTILTKSETRSSMAADRNVGPLRRMFEDLHHINNRLHRVEEELRVMKHPPIKESVMAEDYWAKTKFQHGLESDMNISTITKMINSPKPLIKKEK